MKFIAGGVSLNNISKVIFCDREYFDSLQSLSVNISYVVEEKDKSISFISLAPTNLIKIEGRTEAPSQSGDQGVKRNLTGNQYFVGMTGNNYFYPSNVKKSSFEYNSYGEFVKGTILTVEGGTYGYGIGFDIPLEPSTSYLTTVEGPQADLSVGTYTKDGTWKRYISDFNKEFTTTSEEVWGIVVVKPRTPGELTEYSNLQIKVYPEKSIRVVYNNIPCVKTDDSLELFGKIFLLTDIRGLPVGLKYQNDSGQIYPLIDFTVQSFEVNTSDGYTVVDSSVLGKMKILSLSLSGRLPQETEKDIVTDSRVKSAAIFWKSIGGNS